jgi:ABC-type enterochelin transport system substrate-binding protein
MKTMGDTSMHRTRLVLSGLAIVAVIAMSGCDSEASTSSPAPAGSSAAPTTEAATIPANPATDAETAKACDDIKKDIADNAGKVAKAEKIGPPAGHIAVSAQWVAGSAAVIAHSIGANEKVSAAADKVQQEMNNLGDAYNKSADAKPSKKNLEAAIKDLTAACSAT